jgi:hypothetical protein
MRSGIVGNNRNADTKVEKVKAQRRKNLRVNSVSCSIEVAPSNFGDRLLNLEIPPSLYSHVIFEVRQDTEEFRG